MMHSVKGTYGNPDGTVRWQDMLEAMDLLGHEQGLSIVMTNKMGPATARHLGYTEVSTPVHPCDPRLARAIDATADALCGACMWSLQGNPVVRGYLHHVSRAQSMKDGSGGGAVLGASATLSPNSLMKTSNIRAVTQPATGSPKGTFNVTSTHSASVTQRHKSQVSTSLRATLERISAAAEASADLSNTLKVGNGGWAQGPDVAQRDG